MDFCIVRKMVRKVLKVKEGNYILFEKKAHR